MTATLSPRPAASHRVGAILVAAGESTRMGGVDKVFHPVHGLPLLGYPLRVLQACPEVHEIVLVAAERSLAQARGLVQALDCTKVTAVCAGGPRRQDSVRNGLEHLKKDIGWILVHDGARPCITGEMVRRGLRAARESGAAVAAVPAKDTVKLVGEDETVVETLPRERLRMVQCPQVFAADLLRRAHEAVSETVTDDASMVERLGHRVRAFMGSYANIKVTTPEDLLLVEALLAPGREEGSS